MTVGATLSLGLRELYVKTHPQPDNAVDRAFDRNGSDLPPDPPSEDQAVPDDTNAVQEDEAGVEMETMLPSQMESPSAMPDTPATDDAVSSEDVEAAVIDSMASSGPQSVFDDTELVKTDNLDDVIENMLSETDQEVPRDISVRLEEDSAQDGDIFGSYNDDVDDLFEESEDDAVARALESAGMSRGVEFLDADEGGSPISSTAKEVLGEDFDFDSLSQTHDAAQAGHADTVSTATESGGSASSKLVELGNGMYQAETKPTTDGLPPAALYEKLLAEPQAVISFFPPELVSDAVIETDHSAAALKNSFIEESRPMLARKRKTPQ